MSRLPIAIGSVSLLAVVLGSLAFVLDSGSIARSAATMVLVGLMAVALGGLAGLTLVRAPWARWVLGASVVFATMLASIGGASLFWVTLGVAAIALIGLTGPWLTIWVRQQPVADQLGKVPVVLIGSGAVAPVVVGLAASQGTNLLHWLLIVALIATSWAYGRGLPLAIWGFRVLVPFVGLLAALGTVPFGNVVIATGVLFTAILAFTPPARHVTAVITPPLPSPVSRKEPDNASG